MSPSAPSRLYGTVVCEMLWGRVAFSKQPFRFKDSVPNFEEWAFTGLAFLLF